jgi:prefoldin subunit 5
LALVTDIDQLSQAISHATAPAFMLGAVAAFLSILVARLERVADKIKALRTSDADLDPTGKVAASFARRLELLSRAILFAVLSALFTAALLIGAFLTALVGIGHGQIVAALFAAALALLMASLVELAREMRVYMAHMHLE